MTQKARHDRTLAPEQRVITLKIWSELTLTKLPVRSISPSTRLLPAIVTPGQAEGVGSGILETGPSEKSES